ncbi:hypothetical protein Tco_0052174 [Tanacetum coccineum]
MKETKAYKTYLGFASGATPPKKAQKFKKSASPKLTTVPVSTKEPTRKSKRVNRPTKKSTKAPARGVVIRETPEMPLSKKKEKVDVTRGKGIELLSQVALNKDAQFEEVQRKSMREFHRTHPSGSGAIKIIPSGNDEDDSNNEQDSSGEDSDQKNDSNDNKTQSDTENESDSEHETDENESGSESDQEDDEDDEDDEEEVKDELVKTTSNDSDDEDETKITDKAEGNEDEEMDYTTSQLYDDVDIMLNEPVDTDKGFKTEVPVTSSSHSSDLAAKFLNFSDIPHTDAKIVSLMDVHVHHEVPSQVIALEKEVDELKKDPLHTQVTALVDVHLDTRQGATIDEFMNFLSASLTARITEQVKNQLPQILQKETIFSTYGKVYSLKRSRKDKDEDPSAGLDRGLKKRKTRKDAEPTKEEPKFEVVDSDMPQDQEENLGKDDEEPKEKVSSKRDWFTKPTQPQEPTDPDWNVDKTPHQGQNQSWLMTLASSVDKLSKTFDELMSTPIDFSAFIMNGLKINNFTQETLLGPAFRLLKGTRSNYAELEYDFEECYKALSEKLY